MPYALAYSARRIRAHSRSSTGTCARNRAVLIVAILTMQMICFTVEMISGDVRVSTYPTYVLARHSFLMINNER